MRILPTTWKVLTVAVAVFLATLGMSPAASAAPAGPGNFCNVDLNAMKRACFQTESQMLQHASSAGRQPAVAVYDWINYNQGGGYDVWSVSQPCTTTTSDQDYPFPDLTVWSYHNTGVTYDRTLSSVSTYTSNNTHCDIRLYEGPGMTGDSSVAISACKHLGTCTAENWYNRARSFVLT